MIDPADLLAKAEQALATGRAVLQMGDTNTAAGRAYYAMFNAGRAALTVCTGDDPGRNKTHSGLIGRFSDLFVKTGLIESELGRALTVASIDRAVADYNGESVIAADAARNLEAAGAFVAACRRLMDKHRAP